MAAIKGVARLLVPAGTAKPAPALGQALGPLGVNMMEFCKDFNARTAALKPSAVMRVRLVAREDRTFSFVVRAPPATWFIKRCVGLAKGAGAPAPGAAAPAGSPSAPAGAVSLRALYEVARAQAANDPDAAGLPLPSAVKSLMGTAKSMGLRIVR